MKASSTSTGPGNSYLKLIRAFPLRVVRNSREYEAAREQLAAEKKGRGDAGQRDYLEVLKALIGLHERETRERDLKRGTPLERLRVLMGQTGTTPRELEKIFKSSRALVSLVLHGRRELSKANIRALARHFNVSTDTFL